MPLQSSPYAILSIVSAVIALILGYFIWQRRPGPGIIPFVLLMGVLILWSIANAMNLLVTSLEAKKISVFFIYLGVSLTPPLWLAFVLQYTGRGTRLTQRIIALLSIHPILVALTILTTDWTGIFWSSRELDVIDGLVVDNFVTNWGFWVHAVYSYIILIVAAVLLARWFGRAPRLYRDQIIYLLIGVFSPWIANFFYIFFDFPTSYVDPTPLAFTITGLSMGWALYRFRLLDIVPVARDAIIENLADPVIVIDQQNRIVDVNKASLKILGHEEENVIGKTIAQLLPKQESLISQFRHLPELETEVELDVTGEKRTYDLRISPLKNRQQEITGRIVSLRDITAIKQINEDLKKARQEAEDATQLKSQFLATMSHELRTPLNAIIGFSELMITGMVGTLSDNHYKYQERILANSKNLLALINDILDLSKIEAGRMELQKQPFQVQEWLDEIVKQNSVLAEEKGISFIHELDNKLPENLIGDSSRLRQIVVNLLSNAFKFTQEGEVKLAIRKNDKDTWAIVVSDTGVGIAPHKQETIFLEFNQGDNSATREYGGTGLGLAIVRRFVLMMGGTIRVQSNLGEGSTFTIILPIEEILAPIDAAKTSA